MNDIMMNAQPLRRDCQRAHHSHLRALAARTLAAAGIVRLPVRLAVVAGQMGVELMSYRQYADITATDVATVAQCYGVDGFTLRVGDCRVVVYRGGGNPKRMRWTVAHELAHLLLGHLEDSGDNEWEQCRKELEANALAAELLCPTAVVAACGCTDSGAVAQLCDVSTTAARGCVKQPYCACTTEERELLALFDAFVAERQQAMPCEPLPRLRRGRI